MTSTRKEPAVSVWAVPLYLAAGEVAGAVLPLGLIVTGLAGVAGVLAIGSALIAYGARRARSDDREEVTVEFRP
jgi:hypothetical protein